MIPMIYDHALEISGNPYKQSEISYETLTLNSELFQ